MFVEPFFPRNPETVRKHIKDTKKLIKLSLKLKKKHPADRALAIFADQYLHILRELAKEYRLSFAFEKAIRRQKEIIYRFKVPLELEKLADVLEEIEKLFPHRKSLDCYAAGSVICTGKKVIASVTCIIEEKLFCRLQLEADGKSLTVIPQIGNCSVNCIAEFLREILFEIGVGEKIERIEVGQLQESEE